jgi:membrane protein YdbS with pleckstrin-like domain
MARIDRVKEFINYLKVLLVLLLATDIGLIGWIANNYNKTESFLMYSAVISIFLILIVSVIINKKIIKDIKSLEDL